MMKGTKGVDHGSMGQMPAKNSSNMHKSMGANCPSQNHTNMDATSYAGGKGHGSVKSPTVNTMPKAKTYAQGPKKSQ